MTLTNTRQNCTWHWYSSPYFFISFFFLGNPTVKTVSMTLCIGTSVTHSDSQKKSRRTNKGTNARNTRPIKLYYCCFTTPAENTRREPFHICHWSRRATQIPSACLFILWFYFFWKGTNIPRKYSKTSFLHLITFSLQLNELMREDKPDDASGNMHTSAYVSTRLHSSTLNIRQHTWVW